MKAYARVSRGCDESLGADVLRRRPRAHRCCATSRESTDAGFTQPAEQPAIFANHGAFVLASNFEPWGVVLAEAAASGLPLLCTTACGAGLDLVRESINGFMVEPGDVHGLAKAMRWIHDHEDQLAQMGRRGRELAGHFSADAWAERWHNYMIDLADSPAHR